MDERAEQCLRRRALRLLAVGIRPGEVLTRVGRSRAWLWKWRTRFGTHGSPGLRSHSRRPRTSPRAWAGALVRMIVQTCHRLRKAKVGLIGAKAIRNDLRGLMPRRRLPSERTIYRVLQHAGQRAAQRPRAQTAVYFPAPSAEVHGSLDALDWTCRYLEGGTKVYAFHTVNLRTRALAQTLAGDKTLATAQRHVLYAWKTRGLPHFLQTDNDAVFCGGYKVARVVGHFTRLCLLVGVELIFLPFKEPQRNGQVEQLNGLWGGRAFWQRHRFRCFGDVERLSQGFVHWYMHVYTPPALHGATPAQQQRTERRPRLPPALVRHLPDPLPITAGRVHFLRRVQPDGTIGLLNEVWPVSQALAGHYVWATLTTHHRSLALWFRRTATQNWRLIKHVDYDLGEPVRKRPPSFTTLFTMS
jgi:putative transposase